MTFSCCMLSTFLLISHTLLLRNQKLVFFVKHLDCYCGVQKICDLVSWDSNNLFVVYAAQRRKELLNDEICENIFIEIINMVLKFPLCIGYKSYTNILVHQCLIEKCWLCTLSISSIYWIILYAPVHVFVQLEAAISRDVCTLHYFLNTLSHSWQVFLLSWLKLRIIEPYIFLTSHE